MKSVRFLDRRAGFSLASFGLLLGLVAPAALPAFASAGTLTTRSIGLTSAVADASGVNYAVTFTPSGTSWQHLVIDWCTNTPVIGDATCNAPSGFDAKTGVTVSGGAAIGTASLNASSSAAHTIIDGTAASTSTSAYTVTLNGVHNPTAAGTFYARMYTYATVNYTNSGTLGNTVDTGAVALSAVQAIGVTAYVQESMTFCVSGAAPNANCGSVTSPSMTLGVDTGNGSKALSASVLSTGTVYSQLSTNAAGGAVVNLQSDATSCGGLYLNNDTTKCNIAPQTVASSTFTAGTAKFGLTVGSASDAPSASNTIGDLTPATGYDGTNYFIDYVAGNATGVTSPYGSPVFQSGTTAAPVSNKNIPLTFGASINNNTPAGKYSATLRMIATGTF